MINNYTAREKPKSHTRPFLKAFLQKEVKRLSLMPVHQRIPERESKAGTERKAGKVKETLRS